MDTTGSEPGDYSRIHPIPSEGWPRRDARPGGTGGSANGIAERDIPGGLALSPSERLSLLATIVDCADDAIISRTLDGTVLSWNRAAECLYGYSAEEMVGRSIYSLLSPHELHEMSRIDEHLRRGVPLERFETVRVCKDGSPVAVSLTISPIRNAEGEVIAAVAIARDCTEQHRAQEELRRAHEELERRVAERTAQLSAAYARLETQLAELRQAERARAHLASIVEFSAHVIIGKTLDRTIASWNHAA